MHGLAFSINAPGSIELQPFSDESPLPANHIEGPTLASAVSPGTEIAGYYTHRDPTAAPSHSGYASVSRVAQAGANSVFSVGDMAFVMSHHAS